MSKTPNLIKAIIFDMDGVISDTQSLHSQSISSAFARYKIHITPETITKEYAGIKDIASVPMILERYHKNISAEKIIAERWRIMKNLTKNNVHPITGIQSFVKKLRDYKFILGVASSSRLDFINTVLQTLNLEYFFQAIASGDEVSRQKPNPDIFLLAAKRLDIKPKECLVVEDAPAGIQAAKNACMKCIAITTTHTRKELQKADRIIDSFDELTLNEIKNI